MAMVWRGYDGEKRRGDVLMGCGDAFWVISMRVFVNVASVPASNFGIRADETRTELRRCASPAAWIVRPMMRGRYPD